MAVYCSLGHENPDGSAFCDECGEPLNAAAPAAGTAHPEPAPAHQAQAQVSSEPINMPSPSVPPVVVASAPDVSAAPAPVGTVHCPNCGAQNPAGEAFCADCGNSLQGGAAPAAQHVAEPTPVATPVAHQPDVVSTPAPTATAAAPGLNARLIAEADNQEFDISGKDTIVIGREDAVSNIFPDIDMTPHGGEEGGVSRVHARIFVENGQYMLEDENSTNFTFLNRQRLAPKTPTPLHDNDEIKLGRVLLRFKTA